MRDANKSTREYLDGIMIEERLIDSKEADISFDLWGEKFSTPIMTPAFSHFKAFGEGRENGLVEYSRAMKEINGVNFLGMIENEGAKEIFDTGARTIRIVKPYKDRDKIISQLLYAKEQGAFAVGMDIDHIFGENGKYDVCVGEEMMAQSLDDIKEFVKLTDLPFVVKGVLSVKDALKCYEAGAKGILVSHHHGRMPYAIPPLMILPDIKEALSETDMKIFVDCSIDTGADAFKALAIGADAVCVGRAMIPSLEKDGVQGTKDYITKMNQELKYIMGFTGAATLKDISADVLWNY